MPKCLYLSPDSRQVIFATEQELLDAIEYLRDYVKQHGSISVFSFRSYFGYEGNSKDDNLSTGWTDLNEMIGFKENPDVSLIAEEYILEMPPIEVIYFDLRRC